MYMEARSPHRHWQQCLHSQESDSHHGATRVSTTDKRELEEPVLFRTAGAAAGTSSGLAGEGHEVPCLIKMLEAGCLLFAAKGIFSAPHHLAASDAQRGNKLPSPRWLPLDT